MSKALSAIAVSFLIVAGWTTTASAADSSTVEQTVVSQALQSLGVDPTEQLVTELTDEIDPTDLNDSLVNDVNASLDAGGDGTTGLTDSMGANLDEQSGMWTDFGPTWHVAFDAVKSNFDACRAATSGNASDCAQQFTSTLHIAHAQAMLDWAKAQQALIATLPADQQQAAQAEVDAAIARAEQRLTDTTGREAEKAARLEAKLSRHSSNPSTTAGTVSTTSGASGDTTSGNGKGNGGGNHEPNSNASAGNGHQQGSNHANDHANK